VTIEILSIAKKEHSTYDPLYKELTKMISRFAKVEDVELFNKDVTKAHTISPDASRAVYSKLFEPHVAKSFNVILHPDGKLIDSYEFSKLLDGKIAIKFFIGGAYGFEENFLNKGDSVISLGNITMSHKIAKAVLLEQIYRGFSLLSNHPYHK
jgi:23S rRNA (pseudouridine1915-N3)-methyltransferase